MKVKFPGAAPLTLSTDIAFEEGKFDAKTSYASKLVTRLRQRSYREKKLPLKLSCLSILRDRALKMGDYRSYYEPLAGVGLSARLFDPNNKRKLWLNDLDEGCQKALKENFPKATVWGGDIIGQGFPKADMIFLDFNNFTWKRYLTGAECYPEILERTFKYAQKYVVLNDCSNFYFRYGAQSFVAYSKLLGATIASTPDYLTIIQKRYLERYPGWSMVHAAFFRESTFQLFYKGSAPFIMTSLTEPTVSVTVSEGLLS